MHRIFKKILKPIANISPIALTKNELYDRLTKKIIQQHCNKNSVCVDIGSHTGKILQIMLQVAPHATHYAFEPIDILYEKLYQKFQQKVQCYPIALSNKKGVESFNLVTTNMAYSGLKKRMYDKVEKDKSIQVQTDLLDNIIPSTQKISLIKLDIEGAELWALQGSIKTIQSSKPLILFEFGKAAQYYNYNCEMMFQFINQTINYRIYTLKSWLKKESYLSENEFNNFYKNGHEFFFVAVPHKPNI
ncbi:MAG: FkbM family methyltransferase [Bacteroidetes bacterium]|nr:FkbM family methyltransferase [Bacteroidota bacterium]MBS1648095.1 FkbM family methyltransferase [Bacteroidota bacterium]